MSLPRLSLSVSLSLALALVAPGSVRADEKKEEPKKEEKKAAPAKRQHSLPEGTKLVPLWEGQAPGQQGDGPGDIPGFAAYPAPADKATGTAVVLCPGGGYGMLALDHEGHQTAQWLNSLGVSVWVLKYRLGPKYHHPVQLGDVQRAIRLVRHNAKANGVDPARVGVMGYSAGGHLASTAATHFDAGKPDAADAADRESSRPDFVILGYPVISLEPPLAHMGSRHNLLGKDADAKLVESLCNHKQVTDKTPPAFLFHSKDDRAVPVGNSEAFAEACKKAGVPVELVTFEHGGHGYGLGKPGSDYGSWPEKCAAWLKERGLLTRKP
jgi:acetyl esterase/lipase